MEPSDLLRIECTRPQKQIRLLLYGGRKRAECHHLLLDYRRYQAALLTVEIHNLR